MKAKKVLLSLLSVVLVAVIAIGGTIAYLTDSDSAVNVMVLGNIDIEQHEQDRTGADFVQGQTLMPIVGSTATKDANGYPKPSNYIDKIVTVENTGDNAAYVRTFIAVPKYTYEGQPEGAAAYANVLHWNGYSKGDAAPKYKAATRIPGTTTDVANEWSWGVDAKASVWPGNGSPDWNSFSAEIDGQDYTVYVVTHTTAVEAGAITAPSMIGVYLDSRVDYDHKNGVYTMDGKEIKGFDGTVEVLVASQAVQYDTGWTDAWTALNTAFYTPDKDNHPWTEADIITEVDNTASAVLYTSNGQNPNVAGYVPAVDGDTIDNLVVKDNTTGNTLLRALYTSPSVEGDLTVTNSYLEGTYAMNVTAKEDADAVLTVSNTAFRGWVSFSGFDSATFTNCNFGEGSGYNYVRAYDNTVFENCEFAGSTLDIYYNTKTGDLGDGKVVLKNCTYYGEPITADMLADIVESGRTDDQNAVVLAAFSVEK